MANELVKALELPKDATKEQKLAQEGLHALMAKLYKELPEGPAKDTALRKLYNAKPWLDEAAGVTARKEEPAEEIAEPQEEVKADE